MYMLKYTTKTSRGGFNLEYFPTLQAMNEYILANQSNWRSWEKFVDNGAVK